MTLNFLGFLSPLRKFLADPINLLIPDLTPGTLEATPAILPAGKKGKTFPRSSTIDLFLRTFLPSLFIVNCLFSTILPSLTVFLLFLKISSCFFLVCLPAPSVLAST